jgi:DNA-binding NarL/FixJ family response regulator
MIDWLIIPWSLGALVQVRSAAARRARQELVARAALEERMRVASEVHDVAGHGLAAVAMQAGVALLVFDEQPKQARESLEAIQSTSVQALSDLRTMLDAFDRRTGAEPGGTGAVAGQGLPDLDALADRMRAAGLAVRLSLEDVAVPEDVGQVAYRVVQEALTNTLRHAGPTTAEVGVHREQGTLVVEVLDGGVGAADVRPGLGLTGMRHRVVAAGEALLSPSVTKRLITRFGQRPSRALAPVPGLDALTERERELVAWVATGRSNEEIGQGLFISPATVRTHVGRAMLKLRARDRAQLVAFAVQSGLTIPDEP